MFKKKIALLSLVSIISNFSLFTTNVLAYEIKENSKKIASTEVIKLKMEILMQRQEII